MLASRSAELAEALYASGRYDEAAEWMSVAEANAKSEDISAQCAWRTVAAKLRAREGALLEAEQLGRQAVELVSGTDSLNERAQAVVSLAVVTAARGQNDESEALYREAEALYKQKGNLAAVERLRSVVHFASTVT